MTMTHREALEVLAANRGDQVVITTMGSIAVWPTLSDTPLDFAYIPSSMGQGISLGLGLALALAQRRRVVAVSGDGSLLMNLGSLVTVANLPAALTILLIDNGLYEVTGGQDVAGAGRTDFAGLATAAGIKRVYTFQNRADWQSRASESLSGDGPVFVWLKVTGERGRTTPAPPRPMSEQVRRLTDAIRS
jgi:thiamine pyrophosphate-dependent acetolactate synthase large subunit-like protein